MPGFADLLFGGRGDDLTTPEGYYRSPDLMRGSGEHGRMYPFPARTAQDVQTFMSSRMAEQPQQQDATWAMLTPDKQAVMLQRWRSIVEQMQAGVAMRQMGLSPGPMPVEEYQYLRGVIPPGYQ